MSQPSAETTATDPNLTKTIISIPNIDAPKAVPPAITESTTVTPTTETKPAPPVAESASVVVPVPPLMHPYSVGFDKINSGDSAWMLSATALVLLMTIPGLVLFYAGMVRKRNVLSTTLQSFAICCLVSVIWVVIGYSTAFTPGITPYLGGFNRIMLDGLSYVKSTSQLTVNHIAPTIPESVFVMFQMTFAIITPALIVGAFAERMRFTAMLLFMALWSIFVYAPVAH